MSLFKKKYQVKPNTSGYLFRNHVFEQKLEPGYHQISDFKNRTELIAIPETLKLITITNQEVLTKDSIALRFSFNILYKISDGLTFLNQFALNKPIDLIIEDAEQRIHSIVQVYIRTIIASLDSEILSEKRQELVDFKTPELEKEVAQMGIFIEQAQLRDITFPKSIQDLFAKHLESKIRAKSELENARTAVATARALKNASEIMKGDENIKFFQVLETLTKIADKGKHTFMIGDINQLTKK